EKFYVIPVTISYKIYQDNWPIVCRQGFFELSVINKSKCRFEVLHKGIIPLEIQPLKKIKVKSLKRQSDHYESSNPTSTHADPAIGISDAGKKAKKAFREANYRYKLRYSDRKISLLIPAVAFHYFPRLTR
ncbi:MAG: hypothetical protein ABW019_08010, partial [Chitinophagaceae bacterium]